MFVPNTHYHRYENEGVTARMVLNFGTNPAQVDVWMSREDLFRVDPLADRWGIEVLNSIPPGLGFSLRSWGPGFDHPKKHFLLK